MAAYTAAGDDGPALSEEVYTLAHTLRGVANTAGASRFARALLDFGLRDAVRAQITPKLASLLSEARGAYEAYPRE